MIVNMDVALVVKVWRVAERLVITDSYIIQEIRNEGKAMKRSTENLRNEQEIKADGDDLYRTYIKYPSKINPIFLRAHYPKMEGEKK